MDLTRAPSGVGSIDPVDASRSSSPPPVPSVVLERLGESLVPPSEYRLSGERLAVIAALAGVGAIVLGGVAMATTLRPEAPAGPTTAANAAAVAPGPAGAARGAGSSTAAVVSFLARPSTQRITFAHSGGRIVLAVGPQGRGVLVLDGLEQPPTGASYVAWLVGPRGRIVGSAAIFAGHDRIVQLSRPVPRGAEVAVTVERGSAKRGPTSRLRLVARRNAA